MRAHPRRRAVFPGPPPPCGCASERGPGMHERERARLALCERSPLAAVTHGAADGRTRTGAPQLHTPPPCGPGYLPPCADTGPAYARAVWLCCALAAVRPCASRHRSGEASALAFRACSQRRHRSAISATGAPPPPCHAVGCPHSENAIDARKRTIERLCCLAPRRNARENAVLGVCAPLPPCVNSVFSRFLLAGPVRMPRRRPSASCGTTLHHAIGHHRSPQVTTERHESSPDTPVTMPGGVGAICSAHIERYPGRINRAAKTESSHYQIDAQNVSVYKRLMGDLRWQLSSGREASAALIYCRIIFACISARRRALPVKSAAACRRQRAFCPIYTRDTHINSAASISDNWSANTHETGTPPRVQTHLDRRWIETRQTNFHEFCKIP